MMQEVPDDSESMRRLYGLGSTDGAASSLQEGLNLPGSKLVLGVADGWLSADGNVIYRASDLKVGLFKQDEALQPSGA